MTSFGKIEVRGPGALALLQRLYDWTMDLASRPYALMALALIAFAESSFFPLPPDILLIPMVLAARDRWFVMALTCTLASAFGGLAEPDPLHPRCLAGQFRFDHLGVLLHGNGEGIEQGG